MPQYGSCICIESKHVKVEIFSLIEFKDQQYLLGRAGANIYEIARIATPEELLSFTKRYIVFELRPGEAESFKIIKEEALENFIYPSLLKEIYRQEKESMVLGENLSNELMMKVLSKEEPVDKAKVRKMFVDHNNIS